MLHTFKSQGADIGNRRDLHCSSDNFLHMETELQSVLRRSDFDNDTPVSDSPRNQAAAHKYEAKVRALCAESSGSVMFF